MHYQVHCKNLDFSEAKDALIREKMSVVEHLLQDYPPESVIGRVTLWRLPVTDEYYNVRFVLELPGGLCYSRSNGITLEHALVKVAAELERQVKHLLAQKRNETHWKRLSHPSESIRRTVPVDEDELADIEQEVRERTEEQHGRGERGRKAA